MLGLFRRDHASGLLQLRPMIYEFLHPEYATLLGSIRRMLGTDLSGPAWVRCTCRDCKRIEEEADKTSLPRALVNRGFMRDYERRNRR